MLSMLRNFRWARWVMSGYAGAFTFALAAGLLFLGASYGACLLVLALSGVLLALAFGNLQRQLERHQEAHHRRDRQHDYMVPVMRWTVEDDGGFAAGLEDEREQVPGVVRLRPRGAGPRHSRSRSRRQDA